MRQFFDPLDLRAVVVNWEEVAHDLIRHLHDEIARAPSERVRALLADTLRYPGVPTRWRTREFRPDAAALADGRVQEGSS